jgi:hypothetical protein
MNQTCLLPTPEDQPLFILVYVKTSALQVIQGRLFRMESNATQSMHVLLPALVATLHMLGDAPTRSLTALAQRLGGSEADATTVAHRWRRRQCPWPPDQSQLWRLLFGP